MEFLRDTQYYWLNIACNKPNDSYHILSQYLYETLYKVFYKFISFNLATFLLANIIILIL